MIRRSDDCVEAGKQRDVALVPHHEGFEASEEMQVLKEPQGLWYVEQAARDAAVALVSFQSSELIKRLRKKSEDLNINGIALGEFERDVGNMIGLVSLRADQDCDARTTA